MPVVDPFEAYTDRYDRWFENIEAVQTLFGDPEGMADPEPVESGWGDGSFVVLTARRPV